MATLVESCGDPVKYMPESSPYDHMKPVELEEANALERVSSFPLVANTWEALSTYYILKKKTYPSVTPYLELAEKITTGAASVALATARPVVSKITPTVNAYANLGLDKLEDALPMIHDQPEEIYGSAKAAVASAVNRKIDSALSVTETYVDYYFPPLEEEESESSDGDDSDDESDSSSVSEPCEVTSPKERLSIISHKVKQRAYHRAMDKVRGVQKRSTETLSKLHFTVDLIQYARENMEYTRNALASTVASANQTIHNGVTASQDNMANVWQEIRTRSSNAAAEIRVLDRARSLTGRIQKSCSTLLSLVTKMPRYEYLVSKIMKAKGSADELAQGLAGKSSLEELSASLISCARTNLKHIGNLFEALFEIVVENAPISWLAPEFNSDPLEGLFMQDLEAELRMHDNNLAADNAPRANQRSGCVRLRRG